MTSPRVLLGSRRLIAKKQLGQNFLKEPNSARAIVDHCRLGPDDTVLEIGAGLGALTIPAAQAAGRVIAVETDRRLFELLQTELALHGVENVQPVRADILRTDWARWRPANGALVVIGNLPYHISSPVLLRLVAHRGFIHRAIVMLQKEMADRIVALPGTRQYGRMTVLLRYCARTSRLMELRPEQFFPKPKIASTVVEIDFQAEYPSLLPDQEAYLVQVVRAAFGKRRKTIKNALVGSDLGINAAAARQALQAAGIRSVQRAETVDVAGYIRLAEAIRQVQNE